MPTLTLLMDEGDLQRFRDFLNGMEKRAARSELLPILKRNLEPVVAAEQSILSPHNKSDALSLSLKARSGTGDRDGTMSAFAAPTATVKQLQSTWGRGRAQQRRWAANMTGKGRRRVFYGPMVHQGHRVVKRNALGVLYDTGKVTQPVPFASDAMATTGEQAAEQAATEILDHIMGAK